MKKLCLALSLALSLAAIAAVHAQNSASSDRNQSLSSGKQVTATGCLQRAVRNPALDTGNAVGTSGSSSAETPATDQPIIRSDTKWVLTAPSENRSSGDTVGTSGRAPRLEYRLDVDDESNIAAHEGHKVQITGTLEEGRAAAADNTHAKGKSPRRAPLLKIDSVKMIADDCR
jgi:hypothetical protein